MYLIFCSSSATTCLSSMVSIFAFFSKPLMNYIPKTSVSSFNNSLLSTSLNKVWFSEGVRFSCGLRKMFLHYSKRFCLLERRSFLRIMPEYVVLFSINASGFYDEESSILGAINFISWLYYKPKLFSRIMYKKNDFNDSCDVDRIWYLFDEYHFFAWLISFWFYHTILVLYLDKAYIFPFSFSIWEPDKFSSAYVQFYIDK